mgnify:CR=1 FL=1
MIERYSRKEIKKIWDEKNKYQIWLDIEIAATEAMEKLNLLPQVKTHTQVLVAPYNQEVMPEALEQLARLRRAGINAEIYLEPKSFRQTFGYASRKGIPLALVVAPDELKRNEIAIRNMNTRQQVVCSLDQHVEHIRSLLQAGETF